ncbi:MAG: two-component regulator propeller domain-containing protein [Ferruginibacter sp.]
MLLWLLLLSVYPNVVFSQTSDYLFSHITTANGLVNNQVSFTLQDSKGYIWIGTQTGLQRYDGKRFTTYLADVRDAEALQSDWINTIFEDSKQRLWIGSSVTGPCILNRGTGKVYNFNLYLPDSIKKINGVWQFLEDKKGTIWLVAFDGIYQLDEASKQFKPAGDVLQMGKNSFPSSMAMDKAGNLWFATTSGVKMLEYATRKLFDRNNNPNHLAILNMKEAESSIVFDDKYIWISCGYDSKLYQYTIATGKLKKLHVFTRIKDFRQPTISLQNEFVGTPFICSNGNLLVPLYSRGLAVYDYKQDSFAIINLANNSSHGLHLVQNTYSSIALNEDKEKNIWVSSDAGINIFNLEKPRFITYGYPESNADNISPASEVSDLMQTSDGDVFVSYYYGDGGISRLDKNLNFKRRYVYRDKHEINPIANQLWNLFQDPDGIIWSPNQAGDILQLNPQTNQLSVLKDSLLNGPINEIQQDDEKNIWVAHYRKGLLKIDASTKQVTSYRDFLKPALSKGKRVMCFLFDKDKIWVGTTLHGLQLFDRKLGIFTAAYVMDEKNINAISNNNVMGILPLNPDTLIIATQGGINIFDKNKKTFTVISSKDGLPNNLVQAMVLDDYRNLWVAFAGGLSKVDLRNYSITNYDENDGVIDKRFNHHFLKLKDGRLAIGASKSFLVFDPATVLSAKIPGNVAITGFQVYGKPLLIDTLVNTSNPVLLSYNNNSFHIEFSALQFNSSYKLKYFYQLEGIDKTFIHSGDELNAHYNQLPAGNYIFKIKCANREGVFCKNITTLAIHIIPPFWKTWWFRGIIAMLLILGMYVMVKWRERNIRLLEAGKTKLQQLTAEKYKTQFESEQISSFFTTSLLNKNDVDDVLWDVAKNLIGKLGFVDCMIYLWNEDKTKMVQKAGYGPKGSLEQLEKQLFDVLPGQGVVGAVMVSAQPVLIADTTTDERYRVDDLSRLSEICVPIKYNEQLIGVIDSEHPEKNFYTRQHLQALTTIATLVASKIKSIEAEQHLRHQKAELADINQQLAEVQLASLRSQMNPHFIFNALNSIKKFVIANEPANAEKYLGKFSKLIRSILDNSQSGMVTVEKELQLLTLYLDLEQLRFGARLTWQINVDENIHVSDVEIPSMIVQPFVENAMLHGIMHRENGGNIAVSFLLHTDWLQIAIEDNGVGRAKSMAYKSEHAEPHHSIGIEVATKRLQALKVNEQTPAGITIIDLLDDDGEGRGTRVEIAIPV